MKTVFYGIITGVTVVFTVLLVMIISGRDIREEEASKALSSALKETMENIGERGTYPISDSEEFRKDFTDLLTEKIQKGGDKDLDLSVEFYASDEKNGLLSVKVTETFSYPNGRKGTVSDSGIIVLSEEDLPGIKTATYTIEEEAAHDLSVSKDYAKYEYAEYKEIPVPKSPEGKAFYGWEIVSTDGVPMGGDDVVYIRREEERVSDTDLLISALDPKKEYTYKTVYKEFSNWKKLDKGDADNEYFEAEFKRAT